MLRYTTYEGRFNPAHCTLSVFAGTEALGDRSPAPSVAKGVSSPQVAWEVETRH
jgi:hypothetical protein